MKKIIVIGIFASIIFVDGGIVAKSKKKAKETASMDVLFEERWSGRDNIVKLAKLPPGFKSGRHYHAEGEVCYVIEGTGEHWVAGEGALPYKKGDLLFAPPGTDHEIIAKTKSTIIGFANKDPKTKWAEARN